MVIVHLYIDKQLIDFQKTTVKSKLSLWQKCIA